MLNPLTKILKKWPYNPERNVRYLEENDKEIIQIRHPLGIEQIYLDGRPDTGEKTLFETVQEELRKYEKRFGNSIGFFIDDKRCKELIEESILVYNRYLILFQLGDYSRTVRDTERNIQLAEFIKKYSINGELVRTINQYLPYMIKINAAAKAKLYEQKGDYSRARVEIQIGLNKIEKVSEIDTDIFHTEKEKAIEMLNEMLIKIKRLEKKKQLAASQLSFKEEELLKSIENLRKEMEKIILESKNNNRLSRLKKMIRKLRKKDKEDPI